MSDEEKKIVVDDFSCLGRSIKSRMDSIEKYGYLKDSELNNSWKEIKSDLVKDTCYILRYDEMRIEDGKVFANGAEVTVDRGLSRGNVPGTAVFLCDVGNSYFDNCNHGMKPAP